MEASSKKRKRADKGSSKSSKKIALEAPNSNVSIISSEESSWEPVIASARGISMPKGLGFKPFVKRRAKISQLPGRTNVDTTELLLHSDEHPKMDYTAREEETGESRSLLKHYVAVYDPETDKLEVVEARPMFVTGVVKSRQAAADSMVSNQDSTNARDRRNELGKTFGTKKARKAIASITVNAIAVGGAAGSPSKLDSVSTAMLATMAETTARMSTQAQRQLVADEAKPRPKANLEATKPADVYPIDTLFDLSTIPVKDWHDDLKAKNEIKTSSRFVSSRLGKIRLMGNTVDTEKLKVLRYLLCLLDLYNSTIPKGKSTKVLPDKAKLSEKLRLPLAAIEAARRKFSESGTMPRHCVDLLITHVCVLALIVDNFEIDTTYDLKEDLKLDTKSIKTYFSEVGAKIGPPSAAFVKDRKMTKAEAAQHISAKLRLPLAFPKPRLIRSKRK